MKIPTWRLLGGTEENQTISVTVADGSVEIRNEHHPNTSLGSYSYNHLLSCLVKSRVTDGRRFQITRNLPGWYRADGA
jgi:hypothetical protein